MSELEKQIRRLQVWVGGLSALTLGLLLALGYVWGRPAGRELTVERLNVVEPNGQLKLVLSSRARQHPGLVQGRPVAARDRDAGLLFFNEAGDECGCLVYSGTAQAASMVYSVDQFRNDQLMQLQYDQHRAAGRLVRSYGLRLWDRSDAFPLRRQLATLDSLQALHDTSALAAGIRQLRATGRLGAERLFAGQTTDGETGLFVRDQRGRVRLKVYVDAQGQPRIEQLSAAGRVLPPAPATP